MHSMSTLLFFGLYTKEIEREKGRKKKKRSSFAMLHTCMRFLLFFIVAPNRNFMLTRAERCLPSFFLNEKKVREPPFEVDREEGGKKEKNM